jgi:hypothetical protein
VIDAATAAATNAQTVRTYKTLRLRAGPTGAR